MTEEQKALEDAVNADVGLDFESDEPLVCKRDQSGDETCESCQ